MRKKRIGFLSLVLILSAHFGFGQASQKGYEKEVIAVIDQYSLAREKQDTLLLKSILTDDIDQLVSSGEWRFGVGTAVKGMIQSSKSNEGERTITVDKMRALSKDVVIADARYEIKSPNGEIRKMWSTFLVVRKAKKWKISAIRNMAPKPNP